jgi:DNA-binding IclR family transcriptional regulator
MRLNEISESLDIKNTTAHNLIRTLASRGILEKGAKNTYKLGSFLEELAEKRISNGIFTKAGMEMRKIVQKIPDAVVVLTEINYSDITVKLRISPDRPGALQRPPSQMFIPYSSLSGLIHLAFAAEDMEAVLLRYPFSDYGSYLWKSEKELELRLNEIRKKGYAPRDDENGFSAAVPIFGKHTEMLFALGVTVKKAYLSESRKKEITEIAIEAGNRLSLS